MHTILVTITRENPKSKILGGPMPNPLKIGDSAPDFTLLGVITKPDVQRLDVKLTDYRGRKNVVLAFHPFAFTAI
jgi:peroxiredoxin